MGFEKQLNSIIFEYDLIDKSFRNNFLFSATFNESVIKIIRKFMNDYYFIQICDKEINFIKQEFIFIKNEEKNKKILELLKKYFNTKIIIFTNTKLNSENLFNLLKNDKNYFNIDLINGNKNQNERKKTIENFYDNKINILIATDIIGRGLDFPNVDLIINYDIPNSKEDYIHRIGRSGRMGNKGMSITFIDNLNNLVLKDIILLLNKNNIDIPNWMKNINFDNFVNNVNLKKKNKKKKKKERSRSKDL
jgi:ATP-dependent RNA helicase DDX3X